MYKIVHKKELAPKIKLLEILAPDVADKAKAGQFVILRIDDKGERFPLTIADWNREKGSVTLIFLEVGASTEKLGALNVDDFILDVLGPLGKPSEIVKYGSVCIIGGGVGTASVFPIARAFKDAGNRVVSILGAKTANLLILEEEIKQVSDELFISTDDGSRDQKGFVSDVLKTLINRGYTFHVVYAIGPTMMMRSIAETTRPRGIKTIVSLNPIMVDGIGMCGACRVSVGGQTKFACVDGPEFDAHLVNFDELLKRQMVNLYEEKVALQHLRDSNHLGCDHHK